MSKECKYLALIAEDFEEKTRMGEKVWMRIGDLMQIVFESDNYHGHSVTVTKIEKTDKGFLVSGIIFESDCRCQGFFTCSCEKWRQKRTLFRGEFVAQEGDKRLICEEMVAYE
jgi:hypothetical protein